MATTVIIPCRNEEDTIGTIVNTFNQHPDTAGNVYVGIDMATTDSSPYRAKMMGATPIITHVHGKGQVVYQSLLAISMCPGFLSERIILCDGDYTGLTTDHIEKILHKYTRGMVTGVPEWPDMEVPEHVTKSWPKVSGFRCLPWAMITSDLHGYLMETQLNMMAARWRIPALYVEMRGLKSPFQWPIPPRRMAALEADREWGTKNGVL